MNRVHTILAVAAIAAGFVGWQLMERTSHQSPQSGEPYQLEQLQSSENPPNSFQPKPDGNLPEDNTTTPAAAPVWFVRSDNIHCEPETVFIPDARTGDLIEATKCEESKKVDPYEELDDKALADLAYGDSHAAEVLGLRLVLSEKAESEAMGLGLIYRSVALSGDVETFQKAIGSRYAYLSVNGVPQTKNLKQMLVFNLIGEVLGAPEFNSKRILRALRDADVKPAEIDAVRSETRMILQRMAELQTEVTGSMSIREAIENA